MEEEVPDIFAPKVRFFEDLVESERGFARRSIVVLS